MKKITFCLMAVYLSLTFNPQGLKAAETPVTHSPGTEKQIESEEARVLLCRLEEIKSMDADKLSASEKKALRKEVRSIKKQLKEMSGGIYLSAGAVIIILLILIILL